MYRKYSEGIIEVITGPMFSGKSEELIKRIKILGYGKIETLVISPAIDNRWDESQIVSRSGGKISTVKVKNSKEILKLWNNQYESVAIDEAQFFDENIVDVVQELASYKVRVMISGLDKNFLSQPFGPMDKLLAIADKVDKLAAVCFNCSKAATNTFKINQNKQIIEIGDKEYEARCRNCYLEGMKK